MLTVEKTEKIVTPTSTYEVSQFSPEIQQFVRLIDEWREREMNATSDLQLIQLGLARAREMLEQTILKLETDAAAQAELENSPDTNEDVAEV